eukprot:jgi/Mesen1/5430/ME000027S04796
MVLSKLQEKWTETESKARGWVQKQPLAVEVAISTLASAVQGGAIGGMMGSLTGDLAASMPKAAGLTPEANASMKQMQALAGGPWVQARNIAVMTGVNAGITCALKRVRGGVEDVQSTMAAAFGSGVAFAAVSGVSGGGNPNPFVNALSTGVVFALFQGGFYKLGQNFQPQAGEGDGHYATTKGMLQQLGLKQYEKNFKKGLLNDTTLPLLNDRNKKQLVKHP